MHAVGKDAEAPSWEDQHSATARSTLGNEQTPALNVLTLAYACADQDETQLRPGGHQTLGTGTGPTSLLFVTVISVCFWIIALAIFD